MNAIVPIWKTRKEILDDQAVDIIRNAQFSLNLPQQIKPEKKELIELVIRRWTASAYWLDLFLLGKGRRNEYPLTLPGAKAEEGWAEVLKALFELCIICHDYHPLKHLYYWPVHLWLDVVNDIVRQDVDFALKGGQLKTTTLRGNRNFIKCLKKGKMPSREDWGDCGEASYQLFKKAVALRNLKVESRPKNITEAYDKYITKYEEDTTASDHNKRDKGTCLKASICVRGGVLNAWIDKHYQATGWKTGQLPPRPKDFWLNQQGGSGY